MIKVALLVAFFLTLTLDELLDIGLLIVPGLSAKNAFLYVMLLAILCSKVVDRSRDGVQFPAIHLLFILLISYASFSIFYMHFVSGDTGGFGLFSHVGSLKSRLGDMYLMFLVFFYGAESLRTAINLSKLFLVVASVMSVVTFMDTVGVADFGLVSYRDGRLEGPLGQANEYAVFLSFFIPALLFGGMGMQKLWLRIIYLAGAAVSFALLVQTGSRGGFVSLVGGMLLAAWWLRGAFDVRKAIKGAAAVIVLVLVLLTVLFSTVEDVKDIVQERREVSTGVTIEQLSAGRTWIWTRALDYQMERPWTLVVGNGWRTFTPTIGIPAHSAYIDFLFTLGIIGLGLFLALVLRVLLIAKQAYLSSDISSEERILMGSLIVGWFALTVAMATGTIFKAWMFVWPFTGLCLRIAYCLTIEARDAEVDVQKQSEIPIFGKNGRLNV